MTINAADVRCPKCSGPVWDERPNKKNPKGPDFRCKDKTCLDEKGYKTSVWERDLVKSATTPTPAASRPAVPARAAYSAGPNIPEIDGEHPALPHEKLDKLFSVYDLCMDHALVVARTKMDKTDIGSSPESVAAIAATLFIAAKDRGIAA